jgi:hypothetical protein
LPPMIAEDYQKLKQALEDRRREADQAQGAARLAQKQLRDEFGCSTPAEAEALLAKLERKEKAAQEEYEAALRRFNKRWPDVLHF